MIRLVISDNEGSTTVVPLVRDEISIGRKDGNTIRLTERNISRQHARLQRHNGAYRLQDLGSYNGVLVNGRRVAGEIELNLGDQIQIGDYTMLLQAGEQQLPAEEPARQVDEAAPTLVAPLPSAAPPARLVVLDGPAPGSEFPLPEQGEVVLGRAEEVAVTLDHRSVSREHAKIVCSADGAHIVDLGSANGLLVNDKRVEEAKLSAGDRIELGEVLLRFVGPGEQYVFEPPSRARRGAERSPRGIGLAAGILAAAVALAFFILSGEEPPMAEGPAAGPEPAEPEPAATAAAAQPEPAPPAEPAPPPPAQPDGAESLAACKAAVAGGRYAEAMAHAAQAIKADSGVAGASECEQRAGALHEQEQTFVRGKAALEDGDAEAAYEEFSSLPAGSPFVAKPEVEQAAAQVGSARVAKARAQIKRDPERAAELAKSVLDLPSQSPGRVAEAKRIAAQAKQAAQPAARASKPRAKSTRSSSSESPMEIASACLSRGDNACVVRALNGKAKTAQELGLLIETYRAMGNSDAAYKNMAVYVRRFPTARRTSAYQRMLERRE